MKINGNLVLNTDASGEIQNAFIERLASAPTFNAAEAGRIYYNTTSAQYFFNDGTQWVGFATGGNASSLQTEVDAIETSLGAAVNADGTFHVAAFSSATAISSPTSFTDAMLQLDAAISGSSSLSSLSDTAIAGLTDLQILQYSTASGKWVNATVGSAAGIQPYDAGLAAIAAKTTTGMLVQTGNDTFTSVSLVPPATGITITNPTGVGGNPTFALNNGLASIEALATTGLVVQSAADVFVSRSITGTSGRVSVTNGDGVLGAPTIDLVLVTNTGTGSFQKLTTDAYGRVTGTAAVAASDITTLVDSTYVNVTGDTMSGALNMGTFKVTSLGSPTVATDAATKGYVDSLVAGLSWQAPAIAVVADTAARDALSGVVTGDRVVVQSDYKIYTYTGSGYDAGVLPSNGWALFVTSDQTGYVFNSLTWVVFTGSGAITAGTGLTKTGNVLSVNLGAGIAELPSTQVGIDLFAPTGGALILTTDGTTTSTAAGAKLSLKLTSGGGLTQDSSGLSLSATLANLGDVISTVTSGAANGDILTFQTSSGKWENKPATAGAVSLDGLTDVTITSPAAGNTLVYSSGSTQFVNRPTYFLYSAGSSTTTHTVTHNLGQKYCNVTVVDNTDAVIIPQSIVFNSTTQLTVTFTSGVQCKVVVMGVNGA